jgi:biotin transporter BioY
MSQRNLSTLFLAASVIFLLLGLATLVPHQGLMISDLGYYTFCPFAPWSTLAMLLVAGLSWAIHSHLRSIKK